MASVGAWEPIVGSSSHRLMQCCSGLTQGGGELEEAKGAGEGAGGAGGEGQKEEEE